MSHIIFVYMKCYQRFKESKMSGFVRSRSGTPSPYRLPTPSFDMVAIFTVICKGLFTLNPQI